MIECVLPLPHTPKQRAIARAAPILKRETSPSSDVPFHPPKTYIHDASAFMTAECAERFPGAVSVGAIFFQRSDTVFRMCTSRKRSMSSLPPKRTNRSPAVQIVWHSRFVGAAGSCFVSNFNHAIGRVCRRETGPVRREGSMETEQSRLRTSNPPTASIFPPFLVRPPAGLATSVATSVT